MESVEQNAFANEIETLKNMFGDRVSVHIIKAVLESCAGDGKSPFNCNSEIFGTLRTIRVLSWRIGTYTYAPFNFYAQISRMKYR